MTKGGQAAGITRADCAELPFVPIPVQLPGNYGSFHRITVTQRITEQLRSVCSAHDPQISTVQGREALLPLHGFMDRQHKRNALVFRRNLIDPDCDLCVVSHACADLLLRRQ